MIRWIFYEILLAFESRTNSLFYECNQINTFEELNLTIYFCDDF